MTAAHQASGSAESLLELTTAAVSQDRVLVRARGEVDLTTAPELAAAIRDAIGRTESQVELDLEQVTFIDSSGVGAIVVADRLAKSVNRQLVIGPRSIFVARVFEVAGLDQALTSNEPLAFGS